MGALPPSQRAAFEDHYITCSRCAGILESTDLYVRAMQDAAREIRGTAGQLGAAGS